MYEIDQMNRQTFYMYENYESYQENGVTKYRSRLTKIVKPAEPEWYIQVQSADR